MDPNTDKRTASESGETPKRTSKACLACRARKSKCTLDSAGGAPTPPCQRCKREGKQCVIGTSNRGGRRVRRSALAQSATSTSGTLSSNRPSRQAVPQISHNDSSMDVNRASSLDFSIDDTQEYPSLSRDISMQIDPSLNDMAPPGHLSVPRATEPRESSGSSNGEDIPFEDLQNPSDALDILAQIASNDSRGHHNTAWESRHTDNASQRNAARPLHYDRDDGGLDYPLIRNGILSTDQTAQLVERYKRYYHPYFPLVPVKTLDCRNLSASARDEPHLLTAMLVVASKDLVKEPHVFDACSGHMQAMVSALAAGGPGGVEAVEALLLLAEWTPYTSKTQAGQVGRGEEDREAWMHVGTALRIGYFLGLDRYSFRVHDGTSDPEWQRKRLVWTACYISDRQISIRIGKAFWSRGPGPLTTLRKDDFPSLHPQASGEEDYASIFQATLELTMLFSNVHDTLYGSHLTLRSHLSGNYIKFIDDFRSAIYGWNSVYGTLTCSPNLKATLLMSYDYLRLYTNAFAFHATIQRAMPKTEKGRPSFGRVFYNNVGAVGDARFIYEGLDAAKSLLTTLNNFVDAEQSLRYMPLRFYLYTIYAGVFLYRARAVGVMSPEEDTSVRRMVQQTVSKLELASVGEQHPANRYAQLLRLLWAKVDRKSRKDIRSVATLENPYRPGSNAAHTPASTSNHSATLDSPAVTEQMGDFSWTDLDAIGNFALNGNEGLNTETEWWSGFLPTDSNPFGAANSLNNMEDWSLAW